MKVTSRAHALAISLVGGEAAQGAPIEHERHVGFLLVVKRDHLTDDEVVVAELDRPRDPAVDPCPDAVEHGAPGRRVMPAEVIEPAVVDADLGEPPTEIGLGVT